MTEPARVGVVGCGVIAKPYVTDAPAFETWRPVACSDLDAAVARAFADEHGLRATALEELLSDADIDVVINLTPPTAHLAVSLAAIEAGKHVYSEKPLATTVADGRRLTDAAERAGLRLGCAPDTFLSSAYETGRQLIAAGEIGEPIGATATMLVGGPDGWHPNAASFYRAGGGPLLDIAPYYLTALVSLLGRISAVAAFAATPTPKRVLGAGPRAGETIDVEVPTHAAAVIRHERGALATLAVSFEARDQYESGLLVYGSRGMLRLPDANFFGGEVMIRRGRGDWSAVPYESRGDQEARGFGLHDLLGSLRQGTPHRANGRLALHVLEAIEGVVRSAEELRTVELSGSPAYVEGLPRRPGARRPDRTPLL